MAVPYSTACRGLACASFCAVLCFLSSASLSALAANAGIAVVVTALFFDAAVLGCVVLSVVGLLVLAGVVAALLLGVWGEDLLPNLKRMGAAALRGALGVLPVAVAWAYAMVHLEVFSVSWGVFLCTVAMGCAAVAVIAGQIFTLVIVRILIVPACLPPRVFSMLTGMPEDALDQCRETMTTEHSWEPLAVPAAADGAQVDAMIWEGHDAKPAGAGGRWVVWFLGNGARYEECHQEMEEYAQHLGVSVCAFNYRGVGRSSGLAWTFGDLVTDGKLVLQALCERKQLKASDVLLHGHSLGGAVSSLVRVANPGAVLINDRSFGALSEVPVAWVRQLSEMGGDPVPAVILDGFCALLPYLMTTMGWAAPINECWAANPEVTSKTIILYHKDDEILPYSGCSFHQAYLRSHCSDDGAETKKSGVRCIELELPHATRRAGGQHSASSEDRRRGEDGCDDEGGGGAGAAAAASAGVGSPHNEWVCGLPTWREIVPVIRATLQD